MKSLPGSGSAGPSIDLPLTTALLELARANLSNLVAAQKIMVELSRRQNHIVMGVAKHLVGGSSPAAAVVDVVERSVNNIIEIQRHFLDLYIPAPGEAKRHFHNNSASQDTAQMLDLITIKQ
jgi:hypothetical protein